MRFDWDAPSSVWLRCESCDQRLPVDWRESLEQVQARAEAHQCPETTET